MLIVSNISSPFYNTVLQFVKMSEVKAKLLTQIAEPMTSSGNKVTVVGIGQVGMACAFSILTQVFASL